MRCSDQCHWFTFTYDFPTKGEQEIRRDVVYPNELSQTFRLRKDFVISDNSSARNPGMRPLTLGSARERPHAGISVLPGGVFFKMLTLTASAAGCHAQLLYYARAC